MLTVSGIEKLHELADWASGNVSDEESRPKSLLYVCYCEVCNSVLALTQVLRDLQWRSYSLAGGCPKCHLKMTLRYRALACNAFTTLTRRQRQILQYPKPERLQPFQDQDGTSTEKDTKSSLSFGNSLDDFCGSISAHQLTALYGDKICQKIAEQLCVRAQLTPKLGGLNSCSLFIDGGNIFDPYHVANYADKLGMKREQTLRQIQVSRAFTCYQLITLIVERLPEYLDQSETNPLVVVANLLEMFAEPEIPLRERTQTVNFLSNFLARLTRKYAIPVVVVSTTIGNELRQYLSSRADAVLRAERTRQGVIFFLEKHPVRPRAKMKFVAAGERTTSKLRGTMFPNTMLEAFTHLS